MNKETLEQAADEYIIIRKSAIQNRIEVLGKIDEKEIFEHMEYDVLNHILSQSTPLIPVLEDCFENGVGSGKYRQEYGENSRGYISKTQYISNLKLDI